VEKDCTQIVEWIDYVLMNRDNETKINSTKALINEFMQKFPLFPVVKG
jgi:glycine/serine hydroxymethyltransferase